MFEKYDAYQDSHNLELRTVPVGWKVDRIKYEIKLLTGYPFNSSKYTEEGIKLVRGINVKESVLDWKDTAYWSEVTPDLQRYLLKDGDLLIGMDGSKVGKNFCQVSEQDLPLLLLQRVARLRVKNVLNARYLYWNLASKRFLNWINRSKTDPMIPHMAPKDINDFVIAYPSTEEQSRIALFLDQKTSEIDQAIAIKEQQISLLNERKQIVIQKAVTQGLDPNVSMKDSGVEWIGEIPKHWDTSKIRYLGTTQNGISAGGEYFGSGHPFISYGDVYKNRVLPVEVEGLAQSTLSDQVSFSVQEGDIFFTRTSETIEEIGFTSVCFKTIEKAVFAGFLIRFRPSKKAQLLKEFSKYYFSSAMMRKYFVKEMNLVIRASLSQELLKNLDVLLPPIAEQQKIFEYLEDVTEKIDLAISVKQLEIEKLKEYKTTLINDAVTGKIKVA